MAFKSITEYNEERYGGYLTLPNDGDCADVIFLYTRPEDMMVCDAHYIRTAEFTGYVQCLGTGCPACQKNIKVQTKLFIPVLNVQTNEILFFDRNARFATDFNNAVFRAVPNPSEYVFRITRHGVARSMDTTYDLRPIGKNTMSPYDVILATHHVTFPEYYNTICKEMSAGELARILNMATGDTSSTSQPVYNVSNMPDYQVKPRTPANAAQMPVYTPPVVPSAPAAFAAPVTVEFNQLPDADSTASDVPGDYNLDDPPIDDEVEF